MAVKPRQIALDLGHAAASSRDDLVVSPANAAAVAAVDRWPDWPSPILAVWGPPGSGKSHLANVWRERSGAATLPPGSLGETPFDEGRMPPVLIENADGGALDEEGLFHLINTARAARASVLLTSRRPPGAWELRLPDLRSRLRLAVVAELGAPDDALLTGVITKLFADRQVEIDRQVVQFLVRRIERSLKAAADAVATLDRAAMEAKSRVTRALAASVIVSATESEGMDA